MGDDKRQQILEASLELFLHFGFKRTTMGEIAKQAGVSRPTLYAVFDSKERVFSAVVESHAAHLTTEVRERTSALATLREKLNAAFEVGLLRPFEQSAGTKFKKELLEIDDPRITDAIATAHQAFEDALVSCIRATDVDLKPLKLTAPKLAQMLNAAARGMKEDANDLKELRRMVSTLVTVVSAAVEKR